MAIIERKNRAKKFSYMFRDHNKKPIYGPYFATREEAKEAEIKAKAEVLTGTYVPPTNLTVLEAIDRYLETKTELSESSMRSNQTYRRWITKHYLANLKLRETTPLHVAEFKAWIMKEKLAPTTKRSILSFLRTCMKWATAYDLVGRDPTRQLKLPRQESPKGMHVPIEIIIRILRMLRKYEYATIYMPFLLGGFCGLRVSEALAVPHSVVGMPYLTVNRNIQPVRPGYGGTLLGQVPEAEFGMAEAGRGIPVAGRHAPPRLPAFLRFQYARPGRWYRGYQRDPWPHRQQFHPEDLCASPA